MRLRPKSDFAREDRGSTAVEFALLSILFIAVTLGVIDMARLAWEINLAKAATRAGARFAASNTMASSYLQNFNAVTSMSSTVPGNGSNVPSDATVLPPITCTLGACAGNGGSGQTGYNDAAFKAVVTKMRTIYPKVQNAN